MRRSRLARLGLNLGNLLVIGFFLLPIVTAAIGSLQSEKTLRAMVRPLSVPQSVLEQWVMPYEAQCSPVRRTCEKSISYG